MINFYPHQQQALKETEGQNRVAYFLDMGLGKTFVGAEKAVRLKSQVILIVCQKSKVEDWFIHFDDNYDCRLYDLTKKKDFFSFLHDPLHPDVPSVGIINYELAWRRKDLLKLQDFTLMLDESSLIQNQKAKQTKFILKLKPAHVILLSGTPVGGKYENLWTQCHLLGWNISEKVFNASYVNWTTIEAGGMKHKIVDKSDPYKNTDRLKRKLREHGSVFLKTEEVMDLPEQCFQKVIIPSNSDYKKFMKNSIVSVSTGVFDHQIDAEWDGKTYDDVHELVGDTSLTKLLYARQLCGQYSKDKLQSVRDLIQSTQDRLIIFYNFNDELKKLKMICKQERRPTSEINGHCKDLKAYEYESNSITLCQYQSASKGLNLQKCNKIIYFTLPLSSEHFEQSKKRIHRIGQKNSCMYYLLICRGTVEEQILKTLEERRDYTDELFRMAE